MCNHNDCDPNCDYLLPKFRIYSKMVRFHKFKRTKRAQACKLRWAKVKAAAASQRLFEDVPLPPSSSTAHNGSCDKSNTIVLSLRETSQNRVKRALPQKKDEPPLKGNTKDQDDEGTSIGSFIKNIPNWGSNKYEAPPFIERKQKPSGASKSNEDATNLQDVKIEADVEPDSPVVKVETDVESDSHVEGNSMVLNNVLTLQYDHCKLCPMGKLHVESETRNELGLISKILLTCKQCLEGYEVLTEETPHN